MKTKRYFEFDGLRGLLALWVAVAHLICWCGYGRMVGEGKLAKIWELLAGAEPAAEAFIILSGFAIATLLQSEDVGYGRYMMRRAFRIYPVYLVCLLLAYWLAPATGMLIDNLSWSSNYYLGWQGEAQVNQNANPSAHLWTHLLLAHGLVPKPLLEGVSVTYLMPAWSIGLEEQFYLAAPLLLWALRRAWGVMAVLMLALAGQLFQSFWNNPMNASLPYSLPLFLVGIGSSYFAKWFERDVVGSAKVSSAIVFAPIVVAVFLSHKPVALLIWVIAFSVSIGAWRTVVPQFGSLIAYCLRHPVAQWLGGLSYSLYLLHWPLIIILLTFLHRYQPEMSQPMVFAFMMVVGVPVMLVLSWALHHVVEKPFMSLGRRLASGRAARGLPTGATPVS